MNRMVCYIPRTNNSATLQFLPLLYYGTSLQRVITGFPVSHEEPGGKKRRKIKKMKTNQQAAPSKHPMTQSDHHSYEWNSSSL